MRRNWKRILSLLLTVAMVFTMNTSVFAGTYKKTTGEGENATIDVVNSQGETISPSDMSDEAKAGLPDFSSDQALKDVKELVKKAGSADGLADDDRAVWDAYEAANPTGAANLLAGRDENDSGKTTIYAFTNNDATKYFDANGAEVNYNPDEPGDYIVAGSNDGVQYDALVKDGESYWKGEENVTETASGLAKFMATEKAKETTEPEESKAPESASFTTNSEVHASAAREYTGSEIPGWKLIRANGGANVDTVSYDGSMIIFTQTGYHYYLMAQTADAPALTLSTNGDTAFNGNKPEITLSSGSVGNKVFKVTVSGNVMVKPGNDKTVVAKKDGSLVTAATEGTNSGTEVFFGQPSNYTDGTYEYTDYSKPSVTLTKADVIELYDKNGNAVTSNEADLSSDNNPYTVIIGDTNTVSAISAINLKANKLEATPETIEKVASDGSSITVKIKGGVNGKKYQVAISTNGGSFTNDNTIKNAENKDANLKFEGLSPATKYDFKVRVVSDNSAEAMNYDAASNTLFTASKWSDPVSFSTTSEITLSANDFVLRDLTKTGGKIALSDSGNTRLGSGYTVSVALVPSTAKTKPAWGAGNFTTQLNGTNLVAIAGPLVSEKDYVVYASVYKGTGQDAEDTMSVVEVTDLVVKTVAAYGATVEKDAVTIPYRTTKYLSEYVAIDKVKPEAFATVGAAKTKVSQGSADASMYKELSGNTGWAANTNVIMSANGADKKENVDITSNSLYDAVASVDNLKYQNLPANAKTLSFNYIRDIGGEKVYAKINISLAKSTVYVSANNVSVNGTSHKLAANEIKYGFYPYPDGGLEGVSKQENISLGFTDTRALSAFTIVDAGGNTVTGTAISTNQYTVGNSGTIIMNQAHLSSLSYNESTKYDMFVGKDLEDIELVAYDKASNFTVKPSESDVYTIETNVSYNSVPYGVYATEDGNGGHDNLKKLVQPVITVSGQTLIDKNDAYTITYRVLSQNVVSGKETVSENDWNKLISTAQQYNFINFNAGSKAYVYAKVDISGITKSLYMVPAEINIIKREVSLRYNIDKKGDQPIADPATVKTGFKRKAKESDVFTVANYTDTMKAVAASGNFAKYLEVDDAVEDTALALYTEGSLLKGADAVSTNLVFDITSVTGSEVGSFKVEMIPESITGTPAFEKNFTIKDGLGYIYVDGTNSYSLTVVYNQDGETISETYGLTGKAGKFGEDIYVKPADKTKVTGYFKGVSMNGALTAANQLAGWEISYIDGNGNVQKNTTYKNNKDISDVSVIADRDYTITAVINKYILSDAGEKGVVYVKTIDNVYYDGGRAHMTVGRWIASKSEYEHNKNKPSASQVYDLNVQVFDDGEDGYNDKRTLTEGVDYTITYKNNKDASAVYDDAGELVQLKSGNKRPYVVVKGIGEYKGLNATVYFNILPKDMNDDNNIDVSGLADAYYLKKGKLAKNIAPKFVYNALYSKKDSWANKKIALKEYNNGKGDYVLQLYKYDTSKKTPYWVQQAVGNAKTISKAITTSGNYLLVAKGYNNYTGIKDTGVKLGGSGGEATTPNAYKEYQFFVTDDENLLLDNAKIKTKKVKYSDKTISSADLIESVIAKNKSSLKIGENYYAELWYYDPLLKNYVIAGYGYEPDKVVTNDDLKDDFVQKNGAGTYQVKIYATEKGGYYGTKTSGKIVVTGEKLKKDQFTLKYVVDDNNDGKRAGSDGNITYKNYTKEGISYNGGRSMWLVVSPNGAVKQSEIAYLDGGQLYVYDGDDHTANEYNINYKPGSYSVTVYGKGKYGGSSVKYNYKLAALDLKDAIATKLLQISTVPVSYNASGAMPEFVVSMNGAEKVLRDAIDDPLDKGTKGYQLAFSGQTTHLGYDTDLAMTIKVGQNSKIGEGSATIKGSGYLTGTVKLPFTIKACEAPAVLPATTVKDATTLQTFSTIGKYPVGTVFAVVPDALSGNVVPEKLKVELYQSYYKKNKSGVGARDFRLVNKNQYAISNVASGKAVTITAGTAKDQLYKFAKNTVTEEKFYTYSQKAGKITGLSVNFAVKVIDSNGKEKTENRQYVLNDKNAVLTFTGDEIVPTFGSLYVDGAEVKSNYITDIKGNKAAGTATITVTLKKDPNKTEAYTYGGKNAKFTFKIKNANSIKL